MLVGESGLKRDSKSLKVFSAPKNLYNVTENPLEGTLDTSKPEYIFRLRIRTIFLVHKKRFPKPISISHFIYTVMVKR